MIYANKFMEPQNWQTVLLIVIQEIYEDICLRYLWKMQTDVSKKIKEKHGDFEFSDQLVFTSPYHNHTVIMQ